jgi:HlyD family secretion protein
VLIRIGANVSIDGWGGDVPLRARVRRIDPAAFTKTSALGVDEQRVNVVADLVDTPAVLGDHYRVTAHVTVWDSSGVLMIPVRALVRTPTGWATYVVRNGRAVVQPLRIDHANAHDAEVTGGLEEGDVVVLRPPETLRGGQRVRTTG